VKVSSIALVIALAAGVPAATRVLTGAQAPPPVQPPAQQPPAGAPGQPATPPPPAVPASRKFTSDAGVVFSQIKADKTADFEGVMAKVKEGLSKSTNPKYKQMALSWRVYKGLEAGPGGAVIYVWIIDPPVKDVEYTVTDVLRDAFPNEAQDLWAKYTACFVSGQTMLNLELRANMAPNAPPIK
jgi:hypothetical protein